jgi:hypothetical protein
VAVNRITNAVAIAARATHPWAVLQTGHVDCWGADNQNQLGDGGGKPSSFPVDIGVTGAASIAAGSFHTRVVTHSDTVVCWGNNVDGSLGNGATNPASGPVTVSGITNGCRRCRGRPFVRAAGHRHRLVLGSEQQRATRQRNDADQPQLARDRPRDHERQRCDRRARAHVRAEDDRRSRLLGIRRRRRVGERRQLDSSTPTTVVGFP